MLDDFEDFNVYKKRTSLWVKLILLVLFVCGLFIGWAINEGWDKETTLQENTLEAFNSPIMVKSYTMGLIMYDDIKEEKIPIEVILADRIIMCESGGDQTKIGDLNYYVNGVYTPSFGIGQYQKRTWDWLVELSSYKNMNINNEDDQRKLLVWSIKEKYGYLWSCWNKIDKSYPKGI